ncbi:hypothetical protein PR048_026585 [Dryococelus australis]|uniref:Uncharacterized protein n=1 Tax=Dryococelus australis TaxID=614101 RepID=A0ABQ9GLS7_9NEOP|nr:hypothetical protein PR048_026585 [Dryococelus australis]
MARIVRADKVPKRDGKALLNFDLENINNLSKVSSVDIGVLVKQLFKETKVLEKEMQVRNILFGVTSLDPKVIIHEPTCDYNRMNKLIEALHEANQISDMFLKRRSSSIENYMLMQKSDFDKFEANADVGLHEFFSQIMNSKSNYEQLW